MFDDVVTVMIRLTAMPGELGSISLVGCIKIRFGVFVGEIIERRIQKNGHDLLTPKKSLTFSQNFVLN